MITRERIKEEIDQMPNDLIEKVYEFITGIKRAKRRHDRNIRLHTYKLNGAFDRTDIRKNAYE